MGKSIRSKRRQRVLSVRREKYRELERKKCWDHQLRRKAEKLAEIGEMVDEELPSPKASEPDQQGEVVNKPEKQGTGEEEAMEDQPKRYTSKQLAKLANQWGSRRRKRLKRLASRKKEKNW